MSEEKKQQERRWQPDDEAPNCTLCKGSWSVVNRRKHCRACGNVVCTDCAPNSEYVYAGGVKGRICKPCEDKYKRTRDNWDQWKPMVPVPRPHGDQPRSKLGQLGHVLKDKVIDKDKRREIHALVVPSLESAHKARSVKDERRTAWWKAFGHEHAGKIVFARSAEALKGTPGKDTLSSTFKRNENIHALAVWPQALRAFAIGTDALGKPEYAPTKLCSTMGIRIAWFLDVSVNGKPLKRVVKDAVDMRTDEAKEHANIKVAYTSWRMSPPEVPRLTKYEVDKGEVEDLYAFHCHMPIKLVKEEPNLEADDEESAIPYLLGVLAALPQGEHDVQVELRYRLLSTAPGSYDNWTISGPLPRSEGLYQDTLMSDVISKGSFKYVVEDEQVAGWTILPCRGPHLEMSDAEADAVEQSIIARFAADSEYGAKGHGALRPFGCWLQSSLHHFGKDHIGRCPARHAPTLQCTCPTFYGGSFVLGLYISPADGWADEKIAFLEFSLKSHVGAGNPHGSWTAPAQYTKGQYKKAQRQLEADAMPQWVWEKCIKRWDGVTRWQYDK